MNPNDLAEKCKHCHLFIEDNSVSIEVTPPEFRDRIAAYVHLDRGDEADDAITSTHDAEPSGEIATLAVWRRYGPLEMRLRFDENDFTSEDVMRVSRTFEVYSPEADIGITGVGYVMINTDGYQPAEARALAAVLQERADFAQTQIAEF